MTHAPFPTIEPPALWARLLSPDRPDLVDVCTEEDAEALGWLLPGSRRAAHDDVDPRADEVVVVCQKGLKLSMGAAARLRATGVSAASVPGGVMAWEAAGLPTLREAALTPSGLYVCDGEDFASASLLRWVVERLLPPASTLLAVPADQVVAVAERFDALILATDTVLGRFGLAMRPLNTLVDAVRKPDPTLAALLTGVQRSHSGDVGGQRRAGLFFDAFVLGDLR